MRTYPSLYHGAMATLYGRVNETAARLYGAGKHDRAQRYLGRADLVLKREQARRGEPFAAYVSSDGRALTTWLGGALGRLEVTGHACGFNGSRLTCYRVTIEGRPYHGRNGGVGMVINMRPAVSATVRGARP